MTENRQLGKVQTEVPVCGGNTSLTLVECFLHALKNFDVGTSTEYALRLQTYSNNGQPPFNSSLALPPLFGWLRGPAVEHWSLAAVLSLSCARLVADG